MKSDEFFRAFYDDTDGSFLIHCETKPSIPEFFIKHTLVTEESKAKLPGETSAYDKWFRGTSTPRNHWNDLGREFNEDKLYKDLDEHLDKRCETKLAKNFRIKLPNGEPINRKFLIEAIIGQYQAIIEHKGVAEDIAKDIYSSGGISFDLSQYLDKAKERFDVMKLIGGAEVPLEDFFVCNILGEKERVFADKNRIKSNYVEDATLNKIRHMYEKRGYDNLKTVLTGSGGCGKSLMLQHLFLDSASNYKDTRVAPVFLELRYFTQSETLLSYIVKTIRSKEPKFNDDIADLLLKNGRIQLLMDGLDEIDPSDIDVFLKALDTFFDKYKNVQVLITSRECDSLNGLHNFIKLYVWPFDSEQSIKLIDKILKYQNDEDKRDLVLEYINDGFIKKDGVFASHPLLLTFVTMKYPKYASFNKNHMLFYKVTYEALLSGHDDNKKPYDRVFMSVDNADQFSKVFKEFCAITFKKGATQFDSNSFDSYFNELTSFQSFENTHKMNVKNFKHDVCSTACMMYEKEYDIYYIDPGIQEYLFAEYYSDADSSTVKDMGKTLLGIPYETYHRFDGLEMLYSFSKDKFNVCILLPYLDSVFKGTDEESFYNFLVESFDNIEFTNIDWEITNKYKKEKGLESSFFEEVHNHPKSIIIKFILKLLKVDIEYAFDLKAVYTDELPEEIEHTGSSIAKKDISNGLVINSIPADMVSYNENQLIKSGDSEFIFEDKKILHFGERYRIDTYDLFSSKDEYKNLIKNIYEYSRETKSFFKILNKFYKQLKKEQYKNRFK